MNRLNFKLQRRNITVLDFIDTLNAFVQKLENWKRKAEKGNFAIFETLSSVIEGNLDTNLLSKILQHLVNLWKEFLTYFPKIPDVDLELVRKPFSIQIEKVTDDLQDGLIDFKNESACKDMFETLSICKFWAGVCVFYPRVAIIIIIFYLPNAQT